MSFEQFKAQIRPKVIKSDEEILTDVKEIITLFNKGKGVKNGDI